MKNILKISAVAAVIIMKILFTACAIGKSNPVIPKIWIRVNQAGYTPERKKTAVVLSDTALDGERWSLKRDDNVLLSGKLSGAQKGGNYYFAQAYAYTIDFSQIREKGTYFLELPGAQTERVIISEDPYFLFVAQALMHLRLMRSGIGKRHQGDGKAIVYNVKGDWKDGAWQEASPYRTVDMLGGHYDAGDFIKFTLNEAYLAWHLLSAYQVNPSFSVKVQSTSDLPDILDEAKHSLDYLLKTFPDENTFVIQVGDGRDHRQGWRLPEADKLDGQRPALCALSRVHMGSAVAALALGALVFRDFDMTTAALYENKAKDIYARARKSDTQISAFERDAVNDFYYDRTDTDNMALAAVELYRLTKIQSYLNEGKSYAPPAANAVNWNTWNSFANYQLARQGDEAAKNRLLTEAGSYERRENIWNIPGTYHWSCLPSWIGMANTHLRVQRLKGSNELSDRFLGVLDYTFGCNNWGIAMIASSDLPYSIRNIYNPVYRLTGVFPTGALSEGPGDRETHKKLRNYFKVPTNSPFEEFNTFAGVFYDNADDFMIQETTIGGQGDFILMLALASVSIKQFE